MPQDPVYGEVQVLTPQELHAKGLLQPGPLAPPLPPEALPKAPQGAPTVPSITGFENQAALHPLIERHLPTLLGIGAGAVGGPLAGAGAAGLTRAALSGRPSAGLLEGGGFLGGSLLGKGIGKGLGFFSQSPALRKFAGAIEDNAVNLLKSKVPAWKGFSTLAEMFQGQDELSAAFDKSLKEAVKQGTGKAIPLRVEDITTLGIEPAKQTLPAALSQGGVLGLADAGDAAQKVLGAWKKQPQAYRRVVEALDQAGIGDPKAREAYRWGVGAIQYLNATKALKGEKLDPEKAMAGLVNTKSWDILRKRGMIDFARVLRGGEPEPVAQVTSRGREMAGALGGLVGGATVGHPFLGLHAGRIAAGKALTGIPPLPSVQAAQRVGPALLGPLGSEFFASLSTAGQKKQEEGE